MMRPNKLEYLCLANTFQSSLTFAGSTRTQEGSMKGPPRLQLGLLWPCPQILKPDWKGFPMANLLAYWASSSAMKEKSFVTLIPDHHAV